VGDPGRVGGEAVAVEHVLHGVVGGVAEVRLRVDHQPGLPLRGENVAGVEVGTQQCLAVGSGRQGAPQVDAGAGETGIEHPGRRGEALTELGSPGVAHGLQRPEPARW